MDLALKNTLSAVKRNGFSCIKTYYSQYYGKSIAQYANTYGLKVVLGIRMGESFTDSEIQMAINSCKSNQNVIAVYAGNENLPNNNNLQQIFSIKSRLKSGGCNKPFGTVQTIGYFLNQADQNLVNTMDWLGYNVYPFFSKLGSKSSKTSLMEQINQLKNKYGNRFSKFRIAETGWPSAGGNSPQGNQATLAKAKEYAVSFSDLICNGQINTPWVSYFIFHDPTYKTNVPQYERNFGLADNMGKNKWDLRKLNCL